MGAADITHALAASRRAVRLYPPEHPTHREKIQDLAAAVVAEVDVRPLTLNLRQGRLYVDSDVITDSGPSTRALAEAMAARRLESLTFHMGFSTTDATGLSEVLILLPSPELDAVAELEARDVRAVTVSALEDDSLQKAEERDRRREADRALYRRALSGFRDTIVALGGTEPVDGGEARRAVASLVARVAESPGSLLALTTMISHGERLPAHSVRVMLLSLVLGHRLGLGDRELLSLGMAALMHDTGEALATETGAPADTEAVRLDHPALGAAALGSLPDEDCAAMIVALEHHMGVDGTGWPTRQEGGRPHPYSRIVAVTDRYDDLTRKEDGSALMPDAAVAQLLREASGGPLDPVFARLLTQALGVFPIGTTVRLSDHTIAVVRDPGDDPLRPTIVPVLDPDGVTLPASDGFDLRDDPRLIVEIVVPSLVGVHPADEL